MGGNSKRPFIKHTPSSYIKDRFLSTRDKLATLDKDVIPQIIDIVEDKEGAVRNYTVALDRPLFQPNPCSIHFQAFEPFMTYEVIINFKNVDSFTRRLKIDPIQSPYFSIFGWKSNSLASERVAPGMEASYVLKFKPEEKIDYAYNLVCVSEREKFIVPIRAIGARGLFDFPDSITFTDAPVKYKSTKTILVRNIGSKDAKFVIDYSDPFEIIPDNGFLQAGKAMQIEISFNPKHTGSFSTELALTYDTGETVYSQIYGTAEDAIIRLETSSLQMDHTSIGLISFKTVKLINNSDIMAKFIWKDHFSETEEQLFKSNQEIELFREEARELDAFKSLTPEQQKMALCDVGTITEKYKNLRRKIDANALLFKSNCFTVEPASGTVWPSSSIDVKVYFHPKSAEKVSSTAYCEIEGRESRLHLAMKGDGIGPKARFSYDVLDLEEIFINTEHYYDVVLENRGDIEVDFNLRDPKGLFGPLFRFSPPSGHLKVGEQVKIDIFFVPDSLGYIYEEFEWDLNGSPDPLILTFKGRSVGPNVYSNIDSIQFGKVSYGFPSLMSFEIINTSKISVKYEIRLKGECDKDTKDFKITNQFGEMKEVSNQSVDIEITASQLKQYKVWLYVDIHNVQKEVIKIPITASAVVPDIIVESKLVSFDECFLAYPYQKAIALRNTTDFLAKYELSEQDEESKQSYSYFSTKLRGVIYPNTTEFLDVNLIVNQLGHFSFPLSINIAGSDNPPIMLDISAFGVGPDVSFSSLTVNWGKIDVLASNSQILRIKNCSPIPASFACTVVGEISVFSVEPQSGCILPGEEADLNVTAFLDDAVKFTDLLRVRVYPEKIHEIQLIAKGIGSTILFDPNIKSVDFGHVFSNMQCSTEVKLKNQGRRSQTITWHSKESRSAASKDISSSSSLCFSVFPARAILKPCSEQTFLIKGSSSKSLNACERLICMAGMENNPNRKMIFESDIRANFISPLIVFTPNVLEFVFRFSNRPDAFELIERRLNLKNSSNLPLHIAFRCPEGYFVQLEDSLFLKSNESKEISVFYDPSVNEDRISSVNLSKMAISYDEHPQKDFIDLISDISFPNVRISTSAINFQCISIYTECKISFKMENTGNLPVDFSWNLGNCYPVAASEENLDFAQVFDIIPRCGDILPGETLELEAIFFGHDAGKYMCDAICIISGGPKYQINLSGESSNIEYVLDKSFVDFGSAPYQNILEQEILITNRGRVVFDFEAILLPSSPLFSKVVIYPSSGTLNPNEKQKLALTFCNCAPEVTDDYLYLRIGNYEPIPIQVTGTGVFSNILLDLPRTFDGLYQEILHKLEEKYSKSQNSDLWNRPALAVQAEKQVLTEKTKLILRQHSMEEIAIMARSKQKYVGSDLLFAKTGGKKGNKPISFTEGAKINLVTYMCDFGTMIKNIARRKVIRFTNAGNTSASINIDKSFVNTSGIAIEPDRFKQLAPKETAELAITILGKVANGQKMKSIDSNIIASIQGGPVITINIKAIITIPELSITPSFFDFGEVVHGYRKTTFFEFENMNLVPVEWSSESIEGSNKSVKVKKQLNHDEKVFIFDPKKGTVLPGEKQLIKVIFYPSGDSDHSEEVLINIFHNPKPECIQLKGRGSSLSVKFDKESINLGPILPFSDGAEAKVSILNPTKYPIEIYSLDFDKQYLEDEALLRKIGNFEDGVLYSSVETVGMPIMDILNETDKSKVAELAASVNLGEKLFRIQPEQFLLIIIHGPPFSGKTTVSEQLSKFYGIPCLRLDQFFEDAQQVSITEENLSEILTSRIFKPDCSKGFILDGLETKFNISTLSIVKELSRIHPSIKRNYFLHFEVDLQSIKSREAAVYNRRFENEIKSYFVKELSEEEYDNLNDNEKDSYNVAFNKYKKKLKEIEEKKQSQKRAMQEEVTSKLADKKDDDKHKRKGKPKATTPSRYERSEKPLMPPTSKNVSNTFRNALARNNLVKKTLATDEDIKSEIDLNFNDEMAKLYENYANNIDNILIYLRDLNLEKSASMVKLSEKRKGSKLEDDKNVSNNGLDIQDEEPPFFSILDIDASQDVDAVIKHILSTIPNNSLGERADSIHHVIPESFLEKIIYFPSEREYIQKSTYFSIAPSGLEENDQKVIIKTKGLKSEHSSSIFDFDSSETLNVKYRWLLYPGESKDLCIKFNSAEVGKFNHVMYFEIAGQRIKIPLKINGICQYSSISNDPKKLFSKVRKTKDDKTTVFGEYILSSSTYEFGPLLYSKPRDKYLDKYPENHGIINLFNPGQSEIKVNIALKNDIKGDTFFFDPSSMDIPPGTSHALHVWAYPKTHNQFEDNLLILVKDNPEPYIYRISCMGVRPELELDKKAFSFDKMLLGRVESRDIKLKNPTFMPISWKLSGIETLGDDFDIWPLEGVLESFQECTITAEFCGMKPLIVKKMIRVEVSDTERISGVVQEIQINITAESYDIAMDVHFPKGYDGGLDFGTLKVFEEGKQVCTLKNKGKYEVGFRFLFENADLNNYFTLSPQQGILQPSDKPYLVQFMFKANHDLTIKDHSSCKCQIYEPATDEVTAIIPIKLSARAVFSKFNITPARELNFGPLIFGLKHSRQFVVENNGDFEFKYSIYRLVNSENKNGVPPRSAHHALTSRVNSPNKGQGRREIVKQNDMINFGAFTISPTTAVILPKSKVIVNVEFNADEPGLYEEFVAVDISDRSPSEFPDALEYRISGESCIPGINNYEFTSIFEEHSVMKRFELYAYHHNLYVEEDRIFYFGAYLVGQQFNARFKLSNPFKVSSEVSVSVKQRNKNKMDTQDTGFDVDPKKLIIPSHEYRYVTVSFHPTSIQQYSTFFEAVVENVVDNKYKMLSFEIQAEGTLPKLSIEKPALKSKTGNPWLKFKRLLVGSSQTLQLLLKNDGIIPAKFKLECASKEWEEFECPTFLSQVTLKPNESKHIDIHYRPTAIKKVETELRIRVLDNLFEDMTVQLSGEGYIEDLTFEGLPNDSDNEIVFGNCHIGESKQASFNVSNHSQEILRIVFPSTQEFRFYPSVFHLRPVGNREVIATFTANQPVDIQKYAAAIKVSKIKLLSNASPFDWHDLMVNSHEPVSEPPFESLCPLSDYTLLLSGLADFSTFECDISEIAFKNTFMFQSRVHNFLIKNTGRVPLRLNLILFDESGYQIEDMANNVFILPITKLIIDSGDSFSCKVKFSPMDAIKFRNTLVIVASNTAKDCKPTQIVLKGAAIRPVCHFELEESNYLLREPRINDVCNPEGNPLNLDPQTRVIEFNSCGIKIKNTKRFYIVNPTNFGYEFEWNSSFLNEKPFKCVTPKGLVAAGKKFEIVFEYFPETADIKESLWTFSIPNQNISIPFLLVGQTLEPNIFMDRTTINFKSILINRKAREVVKLINNESMPFNFSFEDMQFDSNNENIPVLSYSPAFGVVGASSEVPIEITFAPNAEKLFNFNLICNVKRKSSHLGINIKGEGYDFHDSLMLEQYDGSLVDLIAGPNNENLIDFGILQINDRGMKRITIINSGKYNFDFSWKLPLKNTGYISIDPEIGTVPKGGKIYCHILYHPTVISSLKNFKAICQITNGRAYNVAIIGASSRPPIRLSQREVNFGCQFLYNGITLPSTMSITILNEGVKEATLDIISEHSHIFELNLAQNTLQAGESTLLSITFFPREAKLYEKVIKIEVNGLSSIDVKLFGEGTEFRVEPLNSDQRNISFGATRVGSSLSRTARIINRSVIPATFTLGPSTAIESLISHGISLSIIGEITMKPKTILPVEIRFQAHHRIPIFSEDIHAESSGITRHLFTITGACQGISVQLENDTLPFGAVVQKSSTTRKIQLQNLGDIGAKFSWDVSKFWPDFTILPSEGYISPGMDVPLEITFHPIEISQDIRYEKLQCIIEGSNSLSLTLTGICIPQPAHTDTIKFSVPVRGSETKSITLTNKTNTTWNLFPIIENPYWTGSECIEIEAGHSKGYDISFSPLEMFGVGDGGKHDGSIFFPLPDGSGILYKLLGTAEKPAPVASISREIPCKTNHIEILNVQNWLKRPQRFKVIIELSKADFVTLKGPDFIDIAPLMNKDYKLTFYSHKEGLTNARITFKNEQNQEYSYWNISFKSTAPGVLSTFEISTTVRQSIMREISIYNPLPNSVTFTGSCQNPDIIVPHSSTAPPKSDLVIPIEFLPLTPKEVISRLTFSSNDLGIYIYDLKLNAIAPPPERSIHFKTGLGGAQSQIFRFTSLCKSKTEYSCKIDSSDFIVEKSVIAPAASSGGSEVTVEITYEPSHLGDVRTQLVVSSPVGGEYICPLFGHCISPRPQGPILIKSGTTSAVPFKNVLNVTATFSFIVDNPIFVVKPSENIPAKKAIQISVGVKLDPKSSISLGQKTGKLTITTPNSHVVWVYYLKLAI